jgi:DnaJ family protein C protein 11
MSSASDGAGLGGGDWTVSASSSGAAPTACCVRYGKDIVFSRRGQRSGQRRQGPRLAHLEVEAYAGSALRGSYIALRNLLPLGRLSAVGLELSASRHSLHLSVHWSRTGQRVSLPVLFCPQAFSSPSIVLWAGALPLVGLAVIELLRQHWPWSWQRSLAPNADEDEDSPQSAAAYASIARRRTEADRLATLLAGPVESRQRYSAALGGLVILNAKYGVRDDDDDNSTVGSWAAEEVADVTVALAALVDSDGRVVIPRGLRKGNLLGFWDPAPDREKVLLVRYSWNGREALAEAKGLDELCLPPLVEAMGVVA